MATKQSLIDRLRLEMADFRLAFNYVAYGDGTRTRFDFPHEEVTDVVVKLDGATLIAGTDYVLDATSGILVMMTPPAPTLKLEADGFYTELWSDENLGVWVETAFNLHAVDSNPPLTYATLPPHEDYLVALLAKIEVLYVMATDAAYDIDIRTVEGVSIPRSQRFAQLMALINNMRSHYKELAQELNVGPGRIVNLQLRRVSRTTNRLVPIYLPREVDDTEIPKRVYPQIDARGAKLPDPTVPRYDIQLTKGKAYAEEFTFSNPDGTPIDLTGYTFSVHAHRSKYESEVVDDFTVTVTDGPGGVLSLTLTSEQTDEFEVNSSMVYHFYWTPLGATDEEPVLTGDILVDVLLPESVDG